MLESWICFDTPFAKFLSQMNGLGWGISYLIMRRVMFMRLAPGVNLTFRMLFEQFSPLAS